jgi:hypothetical protein
MTFWSRSVICSFDFGYFKKNADGFSKAREFYAKRLEQNPNDVDVKTDLGLDVFLANPPQLEKAIGRIQNFARNQSETRKNSAIYHAVLHQSRKHTRKPKFIWRGSRKSIPQTPNLEMFQTQIAAEAGLTEKQ